MRLGAVGERLGNWQLDLIGSGPSADALKAQAASLGDRVRFRGMQPFEVVAESYRTASVCVAPSVIGPSGRQEGIPNVMIEALAYQRPAITTAISGIPELIRDGETGLLVPQRDSAALGQALLRVFSDPAAALEMARRGRRHVEEEFDLTANASRQLAMMAAAPTTCLIVRGAVWLAPQRPLDPVRHRLEPAMRADLGLIGKRAVAGQGGLQAKLAQLVVDQMEPRLAIAQPRTPRHAERDRHLRPVLHPVRRLYGHVDRIAGV